jgi:hypothetical protein
MYKAAPAQAGRRAYARRPHPRSNRPPRGRTKYFGHAPLAAPGPTDRCFMLYAWCRKVFCDELMAGVHGYVHGGRLPGDTLRWLPGHDRARRQLRHDPSFCSSARLSRRLAPFPPRSTGTSVHRPPCRSACAKPHNFFSSRHMRLREMAPPNSGRRTPGRVRADAAGPATRDAAKSLPWPTKCL